MSTWIRSTKRGDNLHVGPFGNADQAMAHLGIYGPSQGRVVEYADNVTPLVSLSPPTHARLITGSDMNDEDDE